MRRRAPILVPLLGAVLAAAACSGRPTASPSAAPAPGRSASATAAATETRSATIATPTTARPAQQRKVEPVLVYRGPKGRKRVALTFDLCETAKRKRGFDAKLVDELVKAKVPATFMMGGHWAEVHPADAKRVASVPYFEVGNHSYSHEHPLKISASEFRYEVEQGQRAVEKVTGRTPVLWRFPFGENDAKTLECVASLGLTSVQWSFETGDPDPNISASELEGVVREKTRNGSILIFHANGNGVHTAEAMPGIVRWLRAKGYELVTVSELLAPH